MIDESLKNIYIGNYRESRAITEKLGEKYPKHPIFSFLKAYAITWESFPLTKTSEDYSIFENHLKNCVERSLNILKRDEKSVEGVFFAMMGNSLLAMYEAESGSFMSAVGYGKKAFPYLKKGFVLQNIFPDFYFSTGLYKYYAEQYPDTHPIAKPFMSFFPNGSKQEGLQSLLFASQLGRFSKIEALLFRGDIYAKYEQNPYIASDCAYKLVTMYPNHSFFWLKYAEHLIALGRFAEAEMYFGKFNQRNERVYVIGKNALKGLVLEKYYKNLKEAKLAYQNATQFSDYDAKYSKDYVAFAYAGLARIAHQEGDTQLAKNLYKKVLKLSEYESLKREAKNYD